MSVWYCIPSKRPPEQAEPVLRQWKERGYRIALWLDHKDIVKWFSHIHRLIDFARCYQPDGSAAYPGYAKAVNQLVQDVLPDESVEWIVTGGDDVSPDLAHTADEIAAECSKHFRNRHWTMAELFSSHYSTPELDAMSTMGVMQPTGDRWGADEAWAQKLYPDAPAYIDRICGSPWMGREFCRLMYGGKGPLYEGYTHMFVDEELQAVAQKLGVLWQRRDLIHYHEHWGRKRGKVEDMPAFLKTVNSAEHWAESKALFESRKAAGFPGHEPK